MSDIGALEEGKQVHSYSLKLGFEFQIYIMTALVDMYAKCGNNAEGRNDANELTMASVLKACSSLSAFEQGKQIHARTIKGPEALELFEEMRLEGAKPDYITFVNILSACSHMGLVERGWIYFNMMSNEFGIGPRVEHYACMVDVLSRAGKLDEAKEFIESATIDHGMCLWRILLSACRNYHNYELGAYVGEKLMELGSQESSAYVLLSSIYTALGRSKDVERVRSLMKLRGVSKEPGCSWIELKSQVHVFVVGDEMHPQIENIRHEIRRLIKHMKDKDYQPSSTIFLKFMISYSAETNIETRGREVSYPMLVPLIRFRTGPESRITADPCNSNYPSSILCASSL
ncbi:Tetratricopeptide repeat-like superfamily protein [Prunus dulcis]|uniref:Tetratricopeptide repeat-like superfamily protein n=1 Tax=Prunus dulcis TaxID=3755 RepID=A0A4Y1QXP8_PRUDU|nr:Tetratricopeptide repeat-like superfamily protein [Prunus dulcis]